MAKPSPYVDPLAQFGKNGRGVSFLVNSGDKHCNAKSVFDSLKKPAKKAVRHAFRAWLDHHDRLTWLFHGWPSHPKYKGCFTFKWSEHSRMHRFYGFLQNANEYEQGFQLCVLIVHAVKDEKDTDFAELDRVIERRNTFVVQVAVAEAIRELKQKGWPQ